MTKDHVREVIDFIELLKKQKLEGGEMLLKGEVSREMIFRYYMRISKVGFFSFEKGTWKILTSFSIFVKGIHGFNFVEENYKDFIKEMGVKK